MNIREISVQHERLVDLHQELGETILRGYRLNTRLLEHRQHNKLICWGSDYQPNQPLSKTLQAFLGFVGRTEQPDEYLGGPVPVPCDGWISFAHPQGWAGTKIKQIEYTTDTWPLEPYLVKVNEGSVATPFDKITHVELRAGLGYSRAVFSQLSHRQATADETAGLPAALSEFYAAITSEPG